MKPGFSVSQKPGMHEKTGFLQAGRAIAYLALAEFFFAFVKVGLGDFIINNSPALGELGVSNYSQPIFIREGWE